MVYEYLYQLLSIAVCRSSCLSRYLLLLLRERERERDREREKEFLREQDREHGLAEKE